MKELVVKNLAKNFGRRFVVRHVSFRAFSGQVLGILGPNGAGKTTVFHLVTGLVRPEKGRIVLGGEDITVLPAYQRARRGIGYLPQESSIFTGLSVSANVRLVVEAQKSGVACGRG